MRIIRPATIELGTLTLDSSNVPAAPPAAYNGGTTYADGDLVSVIQADGFTYKVYESLVGSNTGNAVTDTAFWLFLADTFAEYNAGTVYDVNDIVIDLVTDHSFQALTNAESGNSLSNPAKWLDLGPTNQLAMFDNSNTTQTIRAEQISVAVTIAGRADSVSLLNVSGATATVVMTTLEDGEIFNQVFNFGVNNNVSDWYEYFFEPVSRRADLVISDMPLNLNTTIQVTLDDPGAIARIGALVVGQSRDLGKLIYGAKVGIQDFSRKETDDFGNFIIVQRAFAKRANFKIVVDNDRVDFIVSLLAEFRATAAVYVGVDSLSSTWIYGFYRDFDVEIAHMDKSYLTLVLEGLT